MRARLAAAAVLLSLAAAGRPARAGDPPAPAPAPVAGPAEAVSALNMEQAVAIALQKNRAVIASRLDIEASQLDRLAAGIYPNPTFSYTLGNIVLGAGNSQGLSPPLKPGAFDQTVHSLGVSEVIDVWNKRGMRIQAADHGVELKRLQVEDALREIVYSVRSAYAEVIREQTENQLARDVRGRHEETVRLSRARQKAGEISESELHKVELEGLRYVTAVIDADTELETARSKLAGLMGLPPSVSPGLRLVEGQPTRAPLSIAALTQKAVAQRPDVRANKEARAFAEATLGSAKRDAYPDITLGVTYTHSGFTVSGDNANALALSLSLPLPIFDRNQVAIGRANLDMRRADNDAEKLVLNVQHEVAEAVRREERARAMLDIYEGGMLQRAEDLLKVAERSYKAGAVSLLELLEAQRAYMDTRADYLKAQNVVVQARIDITHAVGGNVQ
jgi:cobalt-zinc-cadmium efflux system outer membrane protein